MLKKWDVCWSSALDTGSAAHKGVSPAENKAPKHHKLIVHGLGTFTSSSIATLLAFRDSSSRKSETEMFDLTAQVIEDAPIRRESSAVKHDSEPWTHFAIWLKM